MPNYANAFWPFSTKADAAVNTFTPNSGPYLLSAATNSDPNPNKGLGDSIQTSGGKALLAYGGPSGAISNAAGPVPSDRISIYVVRPGDTLSDISKMHNDISVNTIRWANNLTTSTVIRPGRILIILPIDDSTQHTMAKNETLEEVVKKYRGNLNETLAFNGWPSGYEPEVGTTVIILNVEREPLTNSGTAVRSGGGRFENYYGNSYLSPITDGYYISQGFHGYKNSGIDMAVALGTPILSVASGCVIVSRDDGWWGGFGRYAVIENSNKTQALYAHMNRDIVSVGQCVARGQVIGYVGSTGRSTGSHLHFELRK
ncbi:MAG: LysM peptidoglycan-binding domain-containing M23 family metallopeptidase [bacterium]|nr:LysM peptidoglycan-binding domain-containing M23 family metallopeptidase [bacterium]